MDQRHIERILEEILHLSVQRERCDRHLHLDGRGVLHCYRVEMEGASRHLVVAFDDGPPPQSDELAQLARQIDDEGPDHVFLIAASHLNERSRKQLERLGVNYVDLAGHAWIDSPGIFVRVDASVEHPPFEPRVGPGPNPFAKKASLVPRALLEQPDRAWGVREMQRETGLSVGHASNVLKELVRRAYIREEENRYSLVGAERLLAHWASDYRWDDNKVFSFQIPYGRAELEDQLSAYLNQKEIRHALTLLAGSDRLARHVVHDQLHLYVAENEVERILLFLQSELQAEPVSRGGKVHILEPYYRDAVYYGSESIDGLRVVSAAQLFLDLAHYPVRGTEAAEVLLHRVLGPRLDLSHQQLDWILEFVEAF